MIGSWGPINGQVLRRPDSNYSTADAVPGSLIWVDNKGADQTTVVNPENVDGTGYWAIYAFNNDSAAVAVGKCYELQIGGTEGKNPQVKKFVDGTTTIYRTVVIATDTTADQAYGWFAIQGTVPFALVDGNTDVSAGNTLKIDTNDSNGGVTTLVKSATDYSGLTNQDVGVALAASTANSANTTRIWLFGRMVLVNQT